MGIVQDSEGCVHFRKDLWKTAGKHVEYARELLLIVSTLPGVNGQNVLSLVEMDCKKEQGL